MWITLNRGERPWVVETAVQATMCFKSTSNTIKPDDSIPAMICLCRVQENTSVTQLTTSRIGSILIKLILVPHILCQPTSAPAWLLLYRIDFKHTN